MKITVNSQILAQELRLLSKIAATKPTIPVLGHVLLQAEDTLRLSATDLEISMISTCQATINEKGQMTLPAKSLLDILDHLSDIDVSISEGNISAGSFRSRLGSLLVEDLPSMPTAPAETAVLSAQSLRGLIDRTSYAISDKEQKYVLKGALFSLTGDVAAMVATDGKRLSIATASRDAGVDATVIVPRKTLDILLDQTPVGVVKFSKSDRHLFFNYGRRLLISRMIDGEFPRYQRIIPKDNNHIVQADRVMLTAAIRRVGLVAETLVMRLTSDTLDLSSRSMEIGDADETLSVRYDGPEIKMRVNWKLVLDFLEHASEPTTTIAVKDNQSPLLFTDGADFISVVMVMRES